MTRTCMQHGLPNDTLTALSRFLMWRLDGLALHDIGGEAVAEITDAVDRCMRTIDRPPERQYLGQCDLCKTGALYARPHSKWAKCEACDATQNADDLKQGLLRALDDRLCTPSEFAKLSTHLGLKANRDQVLKSVEHLGRKGRIERHSPPKSPALYRFGEVYALLIRSEYEGRRSA